MKIVHIDEKKILSKNSMELKQNSIQKFDGLKQNSIHDMDENKILSKLCINVCLQYNYWFKNCAFNLSSEGYRWRGKPYDFFIRFLNFPKYFGDMLLLTGGEISLTKCTMLKSKNILLRTKQNQHWGH